MLFKSIMLTYAKALEGKATPERDPIAYVLPEQDWEEFRRRAFDDISRAVVYRLDAEAVNYADSLREDLQNNTFSPDMDHAVIRVLEEVSLPHDLIWVEHDHAALVRGRLARGLKSQEGDLSADEFGHRALLIDNRSKDVLKMKIFRTQGRLSNMIIDPTFELRFNKSSDASGGAILSEYVPHPNDHMLSFYDLQGLSESAFREIMDQELNDVGYDMAIPLLVFAAIDSPDGGLDVEERESLSASEKKSARKFGRGWMTESMRSHVVIRIGPQLREHMSEQAARRAHEQDIAAGRATPIEHWVAEHERRYKSGKVVLVRAHRRGLKADEKLPRLVKGPKGA